MTIDQKIKPEGHKIIEPEGLAPARGYSHAVVAEQGRTVWVAGQIATDADNNVVGDDWPAQFDQALGNVVTALRAAGAEPAHVVSMQLFTTDVTGYTAALSELGPIYRRHMGRHYPAMALLGIAALFEEGAIIEIMVTAVVPSE